MSQMNCLRCSKTFDETAEACPHCGDRVTEFQRTYSSRLLDGKYQILERLGLGGMGEIFKVRHIHLGEQRVVKIMRSNIATDEEALQRFLHEARLATMIKHRNLAMLYDFSTLDDGSYYMVWEFIDGTNIQKWIAKNGPIPPRVAVEVSVQALAGLEALHQMGVIHRDISPENIMVTQDYREKLLVKVIDFGIAKQLSEGESGQGLTQTGMFLGKLKYASPEQAGFLKEGERLDARSDLYSFGIVLYEMLAGRAPFLSTNPQSYILKHATERPVPISELNPDVEIPARLEDIVQMLLEKDREARQPSAGELIRELMEIREEIAPDSRYGIGENLVTLSDAKTVSEIPPFTVGPRGPATPGKTAAGRTVPGRGGPAADEATLLESAPVQTADEITVAGAARGDEATVAERVGGAFGAQDTLVERPPVTSEAEATILERQGSGGAQAEATILERLAPAGDAKRRGILFAALAAVLLLSIGGGLFLALQPGEESAVSTTTAVDVTATPLDDPAVLGPNQGALLLTSTPYSELDRIVNTRTNEPVLLSHLEDRSVPLRIALEPGQYEIVLSDAEGNQKRQIATIQPGDESRIHTDFRRPNLDKLVEEILNQ